MIDLDLDPNYFEHRKTKRLIGLLGKGADVLPIRLWAYYARTHAKGDGRLTGYSGQEIEACVGWWGNPGCMVEQMLHVGFLDRDGDCLVLHNWTKRQGHIAALTEKMSRLSQRRWQKYRESVPDSAMECATHSTDRPTDRPTKPTKDDVGAGGRAGDGLGGDELDSEIRKFVGEHPRLPFDDMKTHANVRALVTKFGWAEARTWIDSAPEGTQFPAGWALKACGNHHAKDGAKAKAAADSTAILKQRLAEVAARKP